MLELLNRVCWNTNGWRKPSGARTDHGYASDMGFGIEEWNFQIHDAVEGYIYGYLKFSPSKKTVEEAKGHFKIGFWTFDPETRERLLVGIYHDATLVTPEEFDFVKAFFSERGIYERRIEEALTAVPSLTKELVTREIHKAIPCSLQFKCPVSEIEVLRNPIQLPKALGTKNLSNRFSRPTFVPIPQKASVILSPKSSRGRNTPPSQDGYFREIGASSRRILARHNTLSEKFGKWLKTKGYIDIVWEKSRVDIEFGYGKNLTRAEIKICHGIGPTKAIRESIGQLIEYNYYGDRNPANHWLIILDEQPSIDDLKYIDRIKSKLNLPLNLGWEENNTFNFSKDLPPPSPNQPHF